MDNGHRRPLSRPKNVRRYPFGIGHPPSYPCLRIEGVRPNPFVNIAHVVILDCASGVKLEREKPADAPMRAADIASLGGGGIG